MVKGYPQLAWGASRQLATVASMRVPENRRGMKRVSAGDIVVGDWVYRIIGSADPSAPAGEYMMVIAAIDKDTYEGTTIYRVSGDVYALRGEGAWPNSAFLGEVQLRRVGTGTWMLPLDGNLVKGCPLEEGGDPAEWGFDTRE
ncbi:hypothetical protein NJB1907Z4_P0730 (plasmid) [Mycobacterium pseudoshottsii]|uniref:Uncharacterized protein n=4 Tax=Mycobacterium TaxID=1763 RepID=A0A9N7LUY6_9MYCO|nr:hypothetical protein [Mycobacterium marinum]BDN85421.1 hypothetical protein NJB1907Z4_P0730 [Mycobacterium pseudoshottsii]